MIVKACQHQQWGALEEEPCMNAAEGSVVNVGGGGPCWRLERRRGTSMRSGSPPGDRTCILVGGFALLPAPPIFLKGLAMSNMLVLGAMTMALCSSARVSIVLV